MASPAIPVVNEQGQQLIYAKLADLAKFADQLRLEFNKTRTAGAQLGIYFPHELESLLRRYELDLIRLQVILKDPSKAGR